MLLLLQVFAVVLRLVIGALFWLAGQVLVRWKADDVYYSVGKLRFISKWMWPWGNEENGVDGLTGNAPDGWREWAATKTQRERVIQWSAFRNPSNNLRYVPILSPSFDPKYIKSRTWSDGNYFVTQGVYSSLRLHLGKFRFWIGWKFRPGDEKGISPQDTRLPRADFALQFKKWS